MPPPPPLLPPPSSTRPPPLTTTCAEGTACSSLSAAGSSHTPSSCSAIGSSSSSGADAAPSLRRHHHRHRLPTRAFGAMGGLLDALLGGHATKFIKRKDSDAGEQGRALEELRASLYNDFQTSEGAKRQQQRICGPVVTMSFNFMVAVGIIFANKMCGVLSDGKDICDPPTIVLAEFILFRKKVSIQKVIALAVVSIGVAVATVTDLEFNFFGACVALAWILPSAVNKILWSNLQQSGNWTALVLMWKTTPVTVFFLIALMPLLDPPGILSFNWDVNNTSAVIISALFGFLLQWSGALALGATSATSHVVLGQFKTCVIMLGGYLFFNSDPGVVSLCGAVVALCGMSVYTSLNLQSLQEPASKQLLPRQPSFASKPKPIVDNGQIDTKDTPESV